MQKNLNYTKKSKKKLKKKAKINKQVAEGIKKFDAKKSEFFQKK